MWQVSVPARLETYTTDVIITVCNLPQIYLSLSCSTFLLQILLDWKSIYVQSVHINLPVPCFSPFTISPRCRLVIFHNILKSLKPLTIWRRWRQQATSVHLSPLILICFRLKPNPHLHHRQIFKPITFQTYVWWLAQKFNFYYFLNHCQRRHISISHRYHCVLI